MLSNKDFADLISTGEEGKVRFDYKQIAAWDKEIEGKTKRNKGQSKKHVPDVHESTGDKSSSAYRDRALERRKDIHAAEDAAMEGIVAKLRPEQTKFLGGDVEHTHLVKGLDYALLRKLRDDSDSNARTSSVVDSQDRDVVHSSISVSTSLGSKLMDILSNRFINDASCLQSFKCSRSSISAVSFEFDLDTGNVDCIDAVPTSVSRTSKDLEESDQELSFIASGDLIHKLGQLLASKVSFTVSSKRKRSSVEDKDVESTPSGHFSTAQNSDRAAALHKWMGCDDIYGGIVDIACAVPSNSSSSSANSSMFTLNSTQAISQSNVKGIFENGNSSIEESFASVGGGIAGGSMEHSRFGENNFAKAPIRGHGPTTAKSSSILLREDDSYAIYSDKYSHDYSSGDDGSDDNADSVPRKTVKASTQGTHQQERMSHTLSGGTKPNSSNRAARRAASRADVM